MPVVVAYTVQRPGEGTAILKAHRELCSGTPFNRLTGLYAFASLKGARLLASALSTAPSWRAASKRWIISIDGGITEPDALEFLQSLHRSEVRVPYGEELLARRLRPKHRFHPKTLFLERQDAALVAAGIIVGSANLTFNGLCFGHEHAISVKITGLAGALPPDVTNGITELEKSVALAPVIDIAFVRRYAAIRPAAPTLPEEFEDNRADLILQDQAVVPPLQAASLAAAKHFWIEIEYVVANRGRGEEGNQIDMQRGSRVFFGFGDKALERNSPIGSVRILYGGHSSNRNLRFGNNSMDKLDLPIPGAEGPASYRNQTLLFSRESTTSFRLTVGTVAEIATWKRKSRAEATLYGMRGGREFGVF